MKKANNIDSGLLTDKGKAYARYVYFAHRVSARIPFVGKYAAGFLAAFVFTFVVKEGERENARRKTQMPGMRHGAGTSGKPATGEVREMQLSPKGVSGISEMAVSGPEESAKEESD